ncbi:helix-turn-helix domain-containing protein [Clostridium hydrogenum]|uniref:helix-turn-helix domain-containing protein n=1 Tax=Clostridium hydrogenum TaxID=2855764 RepID=UPI001F2AF82E|nr:helix-turn-helix transcriptional regulator [Clostridium hydrogenum]
MSTKENKGNQEIKQIRKELGITQSELAFKGMTKSVIAKLESGERELNPKQASMLATRFGEFGYIVSAQVLLGQDKDVAEILKPIQHNITENTLYEMDEIISKSSDDKAVEIILGAINALKKDVYLYANLILKYIIKLNEFKLEKEDYIQINLDLMRIYTILERYNDVLIVSTAIKNYEGEFCKKDFAAYNFNIANAYYYLKQYGISKKFLAKATRINEHSLDLHILTVESNILTMEKKYKESIAINEKIIKKATMSNSKLYIANAFSNIAYMFTEQSKLDEAQKYINKALSYYNDIEVYYRFNIVNNKFYLELKKSTATFESFKELILLSVKARDIDRMNENIILYVKYCVEHDETNIVDVLKFFDKKNIIINDSVKLEILKRTRNSSQFEDFFEKITK